MTINYKDVAAGMTFVAIGGFFALDSLLNLRIGKAFQMGPGYFPLILGSILVILGIVIALMAIGKAHEPIGKVSWRGVSLVTLSIVFFAATIRGLGMAPSLGISVFLAAMSSGRMSVLGAVVTSVALTAFSVAAFIYALRLPYPVFGPWLRF